MVDTQCTQSMNTVRIAHPMVLVKRVMSALMVGVIACIGWSMFAPEQQGHADQYEQSITVSVAPGDTLWQYAKDVTHDGGDINQTVQEIIDVNDLQSATLQVGQKIVVPVH